VEVVRRDAFATSAAYYGSKGASALVVPPLGQDRPQARLQPRAAGPTKFGIGPSCIEGCRISLAIRLAAEPAIESG
jgi:hypothetical protein